MPLKITIAARHEFESDVLRDMHVLRARVFRDRLGWEVPITSGMEIDSYDALDPHYMLIREQDGGTLLGCWRMLSTHGSNMLKDSFPQLLHGQVAPRDDHVWELSRFTIETNGRNNFGFSDVTMESFASMAHYGYKHGIMRYVTVTTTAIERLLRQVGIATERLGPPLVIGAETAVALYVNIDEVCRAHFDAGKVVRRADSDALLRQAVDRRQVEGRVR